MFRATHTYGCSDVSTYVVGASPAGSGIPVLAGSTRDEWNIFTVMRPKLREMDEAKLLSYAAGVTGEDAASAVTAAYREGSPFMG